MNGQIEKYREIQRASQGVNYRMMEGGENFRKGKEMNERMAKWQ